MFDFGKKKPVTAVLIGAGQRGMETYAPYAKENPDALRFVAVAEPDDTKREAFASQYGLPASACYVGYKAFFENPVAADCALVCTQDQMHVEPTLLALEHGYHVLLEKPMAVAEADCRLLVQKAKEAGRYLMVCHVLRYTPFYATLKGLLDDGAIGRLQTIQHCEGVGYWHFAHSFVRGNWSVSERSAPMILAKCCHDLDLLQWLVGGRCVSLAAHGSLGHFCEANAPKGAPLRCLDGCPHAKTCLYYAPDLYLTENTGWPTAAISFDTSLAAREKALREGPYGRCVYHCDNDVCDHQTVDMRFAGGETVNLLATAFTPEINRRTCLTGTEGEIECDFHRSRIVCRRFGEGEARVVPLIETGDLRGHGGGDWRLLADFLALVRGEKGEARTLAEDSLASHLLAFAAEKSRREDAMVSL